VKLHVAIDEGDGPPLVLLHGWPQHSGMWNEVVPTLARRFRCVAMDLRGLGKSRAPADGYDKATLAADVVETMDDLGIEQARFLGHDWGAVVVSIIASDHPERISKGLMLSVPPPWDVSPDPRRLLSIAHMPLLASPLGPRIAHGLGKKVLTLSGVSEAKAEDYVAYMRDPVHARAATMYYRTFLLRELPAALRERRSRPDVPLHVVGGDRDPICRGSDVEHVRGAGHILPDEKPDAVIGHAQSFL
jgi:pimeloyl-ACP methyl ester carboxylesterase